MVSAARSTTHIHTMTGRSLSSQPSPTAFAGVMTLMKRQSSLIPLTLAATDPRCCKHAGGRVVAVMFEPYTAGWGRLKRRSPTAVHVSRAVQELCWAREALYTKTALTRLRERDTEEDGQVILQHARHLHRTVRTRRMEHRVDRLCRIAEHGGGLGRFGR